MLELTRNLECNCRRPHAISRPHSISNTDAINYYFVDIGPLMINSIQEACKYPEYFELSLLTFEKHEMCSLEDVYYPFESVQCPKCTLRDVFSQQF